MHRIVINEINCGDSQKLENLLNKHGFNGISYRTVKEATFQKLGGCNKPGCECGQYLPSHSKPKSGGKK